MDEKSIVSMQINSDSRFEPQVNTRDIVLQLKASLKAKGLTVQDVVDTCDGKPDMPSASTLRRIFGPGGEDRTYNYRLTLKPLVKEFLDITPEALDISPAASEEEHEIAALKSIILVKEQICMAHEERIKFLISRINNRDYELNSQVEYLKSRISRLDADLDKARTEKLELQQELKLAAKEKEEAAKAKETAAKAKNKLIFAAFVILIVFSLYLLLLDIPNAEYGIFRINTFLEGTAAIFDGSHTAVVNQIADFVRL